LTLAQHLKATSISGLQSADTSLDISPGPGVSAEAILAISKAFQLLLHPLHQHPVDDWSLHPLRS
jgi:hypothetical protein